VNLRQLSHLVALADEGRFIAAAERVHLSQTALSRSIQALEKHFGFDLFERGRTGVVPTPAGKVLIERARRLLFECQCLERDAALMRDGEFGDLAFGVGPFAAGVLLPRFISELRQHAPKVHPRVQVGGARGLLNKLEAQIIDFFVADPRMFSMSEKLESVPVGRMYGSLYCRPGHPLLAGPSPSLPELSRYGFASGLMSAEVRAFVARALGFEQASELPLRVECDDLAAVVKLAVEGDLIALVPNAYAQASAPVLRPLVGIFGRGGLFADLHAIWLRGRTLAPSSNLAIRLLESVARRISEQSVQAS